MAHEQVVWAVLEFGGHAFEVGGGFQDVGRVEKWGWLRSYVALTPS